MTTRISGTLFTNDDPFQHFIEKIFKNEKFFNLALTNPVEAMSVEGLEASKFPIEPEELKRVLEAISSIKDAALEEGKQMSAKKIFDSIFEINETKQVKTRMNVNIRSEMSGKPHTGYNEGWSNSSSKTACTTEGRHKIFPYESNSGPLVSPAERLVLAKKAGAISKLISDIR